MKLSIGLNKILANNLTILFIPPHNQLSIDDLNSSPLARKGVRRFVDAEAEYSVIFPNLFSETSPSLKLGMVGMDKRKLK